ncbi:hypothetical protein K1T71_009009 [Dendrolimus kikuchii]|uniref:Uncharacterized protein n=1 Tax=Dendrolimus kikuchii TaxID=765133 RepID=A0ACC1CWL3_9NEOP|nr:hypothetical protein K1T71_009009 [Dendrolimus kikuchii]
MSGQYSNIRIYPIIGWQRAGHVRERSQSAPRRRRKMLRLSILVVLLTHGIPAYVTETSLADRIDKLYEKLDKYTAPPVVTRQQLALSPQDKLYAKIERLNALSPEKTDLSDDDEELLSLLQMWGLNGEQLEGVVKDLQKLKDDDEDKESEYSVDEWNDEEIPDYPMDAKDWESNDDVESSTSKPLLGITPSAFTRIHTGFRKINVSAVDPIAATNERPMIVYESPYPAPGPLQQEAFAHVKRVQINGKCLTPQARWLGVRQLAPAADTSYMPSSVQLHRCTIDTGCCFDDSEICAPIEGRYVALPFLLHKADGRLIVAKMQFFNHTRCACVSRETLQSTVTTRVEKEDSLESRRDLSSEGQNDWRMPTEEPKLDKDEESTAPPQLRRCTCPGHFLASNPGNGSCSCVCDWPDIIRRRDCQSLAKGKEHFGLRDRVCVAEGHCVPPTCEYGAYERSSGRCPTRRFRRLRFHARGHYLEKPIVV